LVRAPNRGEPARGRQGSIEGHLDSKKRGKKPGDLGEKSKRTKKDLRRIQSPTNKDEYRCESEDLKKLIADSIPVREGKKTTQRQLVQYFPTRTLDRYRQNKQPRLTPKKKSSALYRKKAEELKKKEKVGFGKRNIGRGRYHITS